MKFVSWCRSLRLSISHLTSHHLPVEVIFAPRVGFGVVGVVAQVLGILARIDAIVALANRCHARMDVAVGGIAIIRSPNGVVGTARAFFRVCIPLYLGSVGGGENAAIAREVGTGLTIGGLGCRTIIRV